MNVSKHFLTTSTLKNAAEYPVSIATVDPFFTTDFSSGLCKTHHFHCASIKISTKTWHTEIMNTYMYAVASCTSGNKGSQINLIICNKMFFLFVLYCFVCFLSSLNLFPNCIFCRHSFLTESSEKFRRGKGLSADITQFVELYHWFQL